MTDTDNTVVSWYRSKTLDGEYKLITEGTKEYTLISADVSGYIKVVAVPKDSYGAQGEAVEKILSAQAITEFDEAWSRVDIDTSPSKDETSIELPSEDKATGITFTWRSSNTSVISNTGKITKQSKTTTVTLTATATNPAGETETRRFTIEVPAKSSSDSKPSYGGGGGGGGGGGYIPTPTAAPIETTAPSSDDTSVVDTPNASAESGSFPDVAKDAWYYEYVEKLAAEGIVSGDESGRFNPENPVTRAEFLKMIVEIFNILDESAQCEFTDVPQDSWYYGYIASAVKFDIAQGIGDGTFNPSARITRQDMAVIAARAAQLSGVLPEAQELDFSDSADISDYAKESVASMSAAGIISGSNGAFAPKDFATRAQAAKIISMLSDMLKK